MPSSSKSWNSGKNCMNYTKNEENAYLIVIYKETGQTRA